MRAGVASAPMAFSPSVGCSFRAKDAPKFGVGRLGALRYSRQVLWPSIEMNAKPASISENLIEFRDVAYHINDIPTRMMLSDISLRILRGEALLHLGRTGVRKLTLLR